MLSLSSSLSRVLKATCNFDKKKIVGYLFSPLLFFLLLPTELFNSSPAQDEVEEEEEEEEEE